MLPGYTNLWSNPMPTLQELIAQKAELEQEILNRQREERAEVIAHIRTQMAAYGLTLADLGGRVATAPGPAARRGTGKVAPKFRHPETGQTWSGRGLQPNWLKAALAGGARLEDFAV
jgi:DNA-binding protein H-NS